MLPKRHFFSTGLVVYPSTHPHNMNWKTALTCGIIGQASVKSMAF
jgi:hypothetical protein